MERQSSSKAQTTLAIDRQSKPPQSLSPQELETLIDDPSRLHPNLLPVLLSSLLRPSFPLPLKLSLLHLLDSDSSLLLLFPSHLPSLLHSLHSVLSSTDSPSPLKDQFLISSTSITISLLLSLSDQSSSTPLQTLTELLLSVANRPNHGPDRHTRAVAAECLRELELAFPLLLSSVFSHLWSLAQSERTHAAQSYLLLLATVLKHIVTHNLLSSPVSVLLSHNAPLVPFTIPQLCFSSSNDTTTPSAAASPPSDQNLREIRRVMSFLLERPQALTPQGTMELVSILVDMATAVEQYIPAVAALLKVQFSGLIYSYDPVLCHAMLVLYLRFADSFSREDEMGIARRLVLIPRDAHHPLVFRILSLHWLMGSPRLVDKDMLVELAPCFYPTVFDPLALKAVKLDAMAFVAASVEEDKKAGGGDEGLVVKLFEDGLVCVSSFKWLPPWSSETSVAFRMLHKFLIGVAPHCSEDSVGSCGFGNLVGSTIFRNLKVLLHCICTYFDFLTAF